MEFKALRTFTICGSDIIVENNLYNGEYCLVDGEKCVRIKDEQKETIVVRYDTNFEEVK